MSKLRRFNRNENKLKKAIIILSVYLVIGILISASISFAVYQQELEVAFINTKVRFPKANEVTYTNASNSSVTNVEEALNDLYGKLGK